MMKLLHIFLSFFLFIFVSNRTNNDFKANNDSTNKVSLDHNKLLNELKEGIKNGEPYSVINKYKPVKNEIPVLENNQETLAIFNFSKDKKTQDYLINSQYLGINTIYQIDNLEANSKHLFISRTEGSMRNPYLDCFVFDPIKKEYYLKWEFNRNVEIVLYNKQYYFLSINNNFENWNLESLTFYTFKKNYLHEGKQVKIIFSNYTTSNYENSFIKKHQLVTPEIIKNLNQFSIESFSDNDERQSVTIGSTAIFLKKNTYLTSVGYAPNNVNIEIFDANGNHLENLENDINESVVFSKDFKYMQNEKKQYLIQYAYFDKNRSINATFLKVKVYEFLDAKSVKLIEELNFKPEITFE